MNIVDRLNAYRGDNIFQDVIYGLEEYDQDATEAVDPDGHSDIIVLTDGTWIQCDIQTFRWFTREAGEA